MLARVVDALRIEGRCIEIVTRGATGTVSADLELGVLTELQPGSYVFMDTQYLDVLSGDAYPAPQPSLWVASLVLSVNADPIDAARASR